LVTASPGSAGFAGSDPADPAVPADPADHRFDVVVLGGAFSGAATATLLRRELPHLSVLVVERQTAFDAKVGEATTEMSAMFLTRRLALWEHLEREHLPKEGLRYWFHNDKVTGHADASETGAYQRSTTPSFQLRRDALDEHMLATAAAEGAELWRPARAVDVELGDAEWPGREHRLTVEVGTGPEARTATVACRWLLDATGRATFLGKRLGLIERNQHHPTAAVWGRWQGVRHIDDLAARHPKLGRGNVGSRRLGTNHYTGFGYWIWVIPLGNGETSIGIVFDKRYHDLHQAKDREAEYLAFLRAIPALAELIEGAELRREDLRGYSHLAYATRQYAGPGWALVGDAAAFLDPYYSPGLDHASFSSEATVELVKADAAGTDVGPLIARHNEIFLRSYWRFFDAVYRDKYLYMGEGDLLSAACLLDTAQYYIFVVKPAYNWFGRFHWMPVLGPREAFFSYHLMRLYHRRFQKLALARKAAGEAGKRNNGRRIKMLFDLKSAPLHMAGRGFKIWAKAEVDGLRLGVKRLFSRGEVTAAPAMPPPAVSPPPAGGGAASRAPSGFPGLDG
jgi:flavin-dependent dehydrogenase